MPQASHIRLDRRRLLRCPSDRQGSDEAFLHRCSGSLLNDGTPADGSRVFLTAGHCTDDGTGDAVAVSARVWFRQDAGARFDGNRDPLTGYPDKCIDDKTVELDACVTSREMYNYGFDNFAGFPNHRDVGIVILDKPVVLPSYATLAPAGTIDAITTSKGNATFTVSGYGITDGANTAAPALSFRERLMALSTLVNTNNTWTAGFNVETQGSGGSRGGTCSGDSGGPVFYPTNLNGLETQIVAVTSFGRSNPNDCVGNDYAYRTDRAEVIAWIDEVSGSHWNPQFLTVSERDKAPAPSGALSCGGLRCRHPCARERNRRPSRSRVWAEVGRSYRWWEPPVRRHRA